MKRARFGAEIAWIAVPFLVYLAVLRHLWFNAPVWDDYDTVLGLLLHADAVRSAGEWWAMLWSQHNEHRIAVTRLVVIGLARTVGSIDFRVLMLIGNLAVLGTFLFIWRELRGRVPAWAIGAGAIVMFQWSYFEASLMGSAALPHLGVVFFSFGCLYFAVHGGRTAAVVGVVFGVLAAASQANGLFALPIAVAGCLYQRRWGRAAAFGAFAALAWLLYFRGYVRPPNHPSPFLAFSSPLTTLQLFLVVVGGAGIVAKAAAVLGAMTLMALAWLARKGFFREHPVAALWVLFLLATAGAAAVGRVGFGIVAASRYAIGSTCLLVIACLAICAVTRWHDRKWMMAGLAGAIVFSLLATLASWRQATESSVRGNLLREAVPAEPGLAVQRFAGAFYPDPNRATRVLATSWERGYYFPPKQLVHGARVVGAETADVPNAGLGHLDTVAVNGTRIRVTGWTHLTAVLPQRTFTMVSTPALRSASPMAVVARPDVAFAMRDPELLFSGFSVDLDFEAPQQAQEAAPSLCVVVTAPDRPAARIAVSPAGCGVSRIKETAKTAS